MARFDTNITNVITGTGTSGIIKNGAGTLTLSGANTYDGNTILNAGTLRATNATALGDTGTLTLAGGILELANDANSNFGRNTTVTGDTTIKSERLTAGVGRTHTLGTLSIGAQTLTLDTDATVTSGTAGLAFGAVTLTGAAIFDVASGTQLTFNSTVGGAGQSFTVQGAGNTTISGVIGTTTGGITKNGAGTLTLGGDQHLHGVRLTMNGEHCPSPRLRT